MHYFQDSLTGAVLRWYVGLDGGHINTWRDLANAFLRQYKYNEDMAPDRSRLQNLSKTDTEGFKDYAQRCCELAAQVQPPLSEREMASMFIDTLPSPFYDKVVGSVASNFADLVIIGERIEAGIKRGRFAQDRGSTSLVKKVEKRRGDTNTVIADSSQGQSKLILSSSGVVSPSDTPSQVAVANTPEAPNLRLVRQRRVFTPIPLPYSTLFPLLLERGMIAILPLKPLEPPYPRSYDPNAKCDYHSGVVGHSTERCCNLKHKVQDLIEAGWLGFKGNEPNISTNPLSTHEGQSINTLSHNVLAPNQGKGTPQTIGQVAATGQEWARPFQPLIIQCDPIRPAPLIIAAPPKPAYKNNHAVPWHYDLILEELPKKQADDPPSEEITNIAEPRGMTSSGRVYTPENLGRKNPKENPKGTPKEKVAEEFLKLIRYSEYELLDHLNKTLARISLLSLLLNSKSHRNLLLKVLKEAHVAPDITAERFGGIIGSLTSSGRLTFSDEEIPAEGRQHNQPLHIAVKCRDYMIIKVLINNGSSLNVFPKATLDKLSSIHAQLKASLVVVRAFDDSRRDVMGEVTLHIYIGPTLFNITFQLSSGKTLNPRSRGRTLFPPPKSQIYRKLATGQCNGGARIGNHHPRAKGIHQRRRGVSGNLLPGTRTYVRCGKPHTLLRCRRNGISSHDQRRVPTGQGVGPLLEGIPAPIKIQENKGRAGLGYQTGNQDKNGQAFPA
ncbi:hypothetical protein CR513_00598, partial [Mucuna pruriens]